MSNIDCAMRRSGKPECVADCESSTCPHHPGFQQFQAPPASVMPEPEPPPVKLFGRTCKNGHSYNSEFGTEPCPECGAVPA